MENKFIPNGYHIEEEKIKFITKDKSSTPYTKIESKNDFYSPVMFQRSTDTFCRR